MAQPPTQPGQPGQPRSLPPQQQQQQGFPRAQPRPPQQGFQQGAPGPRPPFQQPSGIQGGPRPPMPPGYAGPGQGMSSPNNPSGPSPQQRNGTMPTQPPGQRPPQPMQRAGPGLAAEMASMSLAPSQPQSPMSPGSAQDAAAPAAAARNKRSARAYHQDAPSDPTAGTDAGWNDAPPNQVQQQAWQQAAAARLAQYGDQPHDFEGSADDALDQIPGQRNVLHPMHAAANQQRLAAQRGQVHPHGPPGQGQFAQNLPITPGMPGPHTPGVAPQHQLQPQAGIGQPPHQGGQKLRGPKANISADQVPAPVENQEADQAFFDKQWFSTCGTGGLPLSTTDFGAVDQGNSNPKFMRLTTYSMPFSEELANTAQLPLAVNVQPLAQLRADEDPVPVIDCGPSGPPRCKRCRGYINPWVIFVEGGQKWVCNLCGTPTEVSPDYFCNLDTSGRRADFDQRVELQRGTVEFVVPKEYWAIQSKPPASVMLPVAPALADTATAKLSPLPDPNSQQDGADGAGGFAGSTMGLTGQGGQAAKAATKAASDALGNLAMGPGKATVRAPRPLTYFFAIDVSYSAVRSGSLRAATDSIREALYGPREANGTNGQGAEADGAEASTSTAPSPAGFGLPHGSRVAFLTFDRALHFYNLSAELDSAQMLVVADIDEPFVPISDGLLADPWDSRHVVEGLLDNLPTIFADNMSSEAALGSAIRGAQACLSTIGGQVNVFLSTIPTVGPGSLKHREDTKLYGTDKEKQLFVPADGFYRGVAEECVEAGIGINSFVFPSQYIDVASISALCGTTGGDIFFHPRFDPVRDGVKLQGQVQRTVLREVGYNATVRLRCSNGLNPTQHYGNFYQRNATDLEFGNIDADEAISVLLKHDGRLDEKREAHFQCALLYTTSYGERRVRCHNIAVPVTNLLGNVFRYADLDSTIAYYAKEVSTLAQNKSLQDLRHYLTDRCAKILLAYKKNCAASSGPQQLILPESFKLLPLYVLCINKSKAIKGGNVTSDVRVHHMRVLRSMGVGNIMAFLYPRMIALHTMSPEDGRPIKIQQEDGTEVEGARTKCPTLMRPSFQRMQGHGAYLVENTDNCLLWIGAEVNPRFLDDLYGVQSLDELDPRMTTLPKLPTNLSGQVRALVASFAAQRNKPSLPVLVARQNRDASEVEAANMLVEDENNGAMSMVDYLCHVHRIISSAMIGGSASGGGGGGHDDGAAQAEAHSLWRGW
ncbi:unnamed protein product [Parajaminaea phylloscopi]